MFKPDFEIEKPPKKTITLETEDFCLYLVFAFVLGFVSMGLILGY